MGLDGRFKTKEEKLQEKKNLRLQKQKQRIGFLSGTTDITGKPKFPTENTPFSRKFLCYDFLKRERAMGRQVTVSDWDACDQLVGNTWTDAARAAALASRKAHSKSNQKFKYSMYGTRGQSKRALQAAYAGNHEGASEYHKAAAWGHNEMLLDYKNKLDEGEKDRHREARDFHFQAAELHRRAMKRTTDPRAHSSMTGNGGPGSGRHKGGGKYSDYGQSAPHSAMSHESVNDYIGEADEAEDQPVHGSERKALHNFVNHYHQNRMKNGVDYNHVVGYSKKAGLNKKLANRLHDYIVYHHEIKPDEGTQNMEMTENMTLADLTEDQFLTLVDNKWSPQARAAALLARRSKHGVKIAKEGEDPEMDLTPDEAMHADKHDPEYHKKMSAYHYGEEKKYRDKAKKGFHWGGGLVGTAAGYMAGAGTGNPAAALGGAIGGGYFGHKVMQKHYEGLADMHHSIGEHHELRHLHMTSSHATERRSRGKKGAMHAVTGNAEAEAAIQVLVDNVGYPTEYVINPFVSEKQRRFMWAKHPKIAKKWADEYPGQKDLPMRKKKKRTDNKYRERGDGIDHRIDHPSGKPPLNLDPQEPVEEHDEDEGRREEIDRAEVPEWSEKGATDLRVRDGKRGRTLRRLPPDDEDDDLQDTYKSQTVNEAEDEDMPEEDTGADRETVDNSEASLEVDEMNSLIANMFTEDGVSVVDNTSSVNEEIRMKLKAVERDELVDNLVTNCDCWKGHRGSRAILNRMSDEQLIALNRAWLERTTNNDDEGAGGDPDEDEDAPAPGATGEEEDENTIRDDEHDVGFESAELPKNYDRSGVKRGLPRGKPTGPVTGGGDYHTGRTGMQRGDEYLDEGYERDISDINDDNYEGDEQPARNAAMLNRWLDAIQAPPFVRNMIRNGQKADMELKANLIEAIVANKNNPYSEDELEQMTTNQLTPLAKLAGATMQQNETIPTAAPRRRREPILNRIARFDSGHQQPVQNRNDDDGDLIPMTLNNDWTETETRMAKFKRPAVQGS